MTTRHACHCDLHLYAKSRLFAQNWEPTEHTVRIAATAGSTAFQWWHSKGKERHTGAEVRTDASCIAVDEQPSALTHTATGL